MGHSGKGHQHHFAKRFSNPEDVADYARRSQHFPFRNRGLWSVLDSLEPAGTWLVPGCGPGLVTIETVRHFHNLRLKGVDSSESMFEYARNHAAVEDVEDRVDFRLGDVTDPDVLSGLSPASGMVSTYTLHHFEDGMVAITAMAGALAPDGPILLCDFRHIWWLR